MTDKLTAAAAALEALRWSFDGARWQPPRDRSGNTQLEVAEFMYDFLDAEWTVASERAHRDVGMQARCDQLGPLMDAWQSVRPPRSDNDNGTPPTANS